MEAEAPISPAGKENLFVGFDVAFADVFHQCGPLFNLIHRKAPHSVWPGLHAADGGMQGLGTDIRPCHLANQGQGKFRIFLSGCMAGGIHAQHIGQRPTWAGLSLK